LSKNDFKQSAGMKMLASNLWVQNPRRLYGKLSKKVHQTLSNRKRNMSEPLRLALETCIIRAE